MIATTKDSSMRADDLVTKTEIGRAFLGHGSGRALLAVSMCLIAARSLAGGLSASDGFVVIATVVLVGPYEWVIHKFLLHAPPGSSRLERLGIGRGHVEHHKDPADIRWLMLHWTEALLFWSLLGVQSALLSWPVVAAADASLVPVWLSTWVAATLALLHYEWTHLLVHTRYRCRSWHYRSLQRHHRLHHYRNEHYWLGVTARSGDRLLATMPAKSAIAPSPTARTLERT